MKGLDKEALAKWQSYQRNLVRSTPVPREDQLARKARMERLQKHPEEFFKYYFPNYYTAEPAEFHKAATRRVLKHDKWYEVRAWSRELAKSVRTMMEALYMALTGRCKNFLLVSHSFDNACELLMPFMINLESNQRIISDYGLQRGIRAWEMGKFVTVGGVSFRAIGAGQSPRGTRNEEARPDFIIIDDIDTDEKSRNQRRIEDTWKWIERALIPTLSVSGSKRIIFLGNIISKESVIVKATRVADHYEVINIRDKNGASSWPTKNSEADIDYILSKISYTSAQQEYYNNPVTEGTVFHEMYYKPIVPLKSYGVLVCYTDPSFKDSRKNDYKATVLMGKWKNEYHILKAYVEQTTTARMALWMKEIYDYVADRAPLYFYMESNATQDSILETVKKVIAAEGWKFWVTGDYRSKGDKFSRIESALEPLNRNGMLYLNQSEHANPHMKRLEEQFMSLEPSLSSHDDGPDAVEGAKYIIDQKIVAMQPIQLGQRGQGNYKSKRRF